MENQTRGYTAFKPTENLLAAAADPSMTCSSKWRQHCLAAATLTLLLLLFHSAQLLLQQEG
jgi:hypothetical protein